MRSTYGRTVADYVLDASDLQDLDDRLDALSGDPEFWEHERAPVPSPPPTLEQALEQLESASLDMRSLVAVLGKNGADRCQEGHMVWKSIGRRLIEWTQGMQGLAQNLKKLTPAPAAPPRPAPAAYRNVAEILFAPELPLTVREELANLLHGIAAAAVIGRAEENALRLEPWLARSLADAFARTPERFFASMRFERLSHIAAAIVGGAVEARVISQFVEKWRHEAEASGEGVYFPVRQIDDAEAE